MLWHAWGLAAKYMPPLAKPDEPRRNRWVLTISAAAKGSVSWYRVECTMFGPVEPDNYQVPCGNLIQRRAPFLGMMIVVLLEWLLVPADQLTAFVSGGVRLAGCGWDRLGPNNLKGMHNPSARSVKGTVWRDWQYLSSALSENTRQQAEGLTLHPGSSCQR